MKSICIFGDSTAWGAWDLEKGGWVNRLQTYIVRDLKRTEPDIYNLSISGGNSRSILERFEDESKRRYVDGLIFQTGANEAFYEKDADRTQVSVDDFRKDIKEIINRARMITPNIAFIGPENCDESRTMPVSWESIYYTNKNIERYNTIIGEVCAEGNSPFLNWFGMLKKEDFADGLHPNTEGHQKMFERVKEFLIEQSWLIS